MGGAGTPRVLVVTHPAMAGHRPPGHPERPERLVAVSAGVADGAREASVELLTATAEPIGDPILTLVHRTAHVAALDALEARGGGWLDPDTYVGPGSMLAARLAAGASVAAAQAVAREEVEVAFAVVRPPGHHAGAERAAGFCVFNNVALAVAALRAEGLARRVAVLDWDVHHGDGTQAIFDADPDLLYASTHQSPLYPGSGDRRARGLGAAVGTKHNHPLPPGAGDDAFILAWTAQLLPAVAAFAPEAILVSAGYDAHHLDPLAGLAVTEAGFGEVARATGVTATAAGLGGVTLVLEGGYHLAALRASAAASVSSLLLGLRHARPRGR